MCRLFLHDLAEQAKGEFRGKAKKARAWQITEFTGISSPYEALENSELIVNTGAAELDACVKQVIGEIIRRGIIFHQ